MQKQAPPHLMWANSINVRIADRFCGYWHFTCSSGAQMHIKTILYFRI